MATVSINFAYKLQAFWHEWNIRIFVLLSQFLQVVLYLSLPHRRCISNSFILFLINGTYVVSFTVAGMALAYISSGMPGQKGYQPPLVLWASFMLLHLASGGDTTAHTLDDYETWYKRFFNFFFHDLVIFCVIWFQWRHVAVPGTWAFILPIAYFFATTQVCRLRLGQRDLRGISSPFEKAAASRALEEKKKPRNAAEFINTALKYYHSSKKLILGLSLTTTEREHIRRDFLDLDAETAVRIVETELHYAYGAYFEVGVDPPLDMDQSWRSEVVAFAWHSGVVAMFLALGIKISFLSGSALDDKYNGTDILITRILSFCTACPYFINWLAVLPGCCCNLFEKVPRTIKNRRIYAFFKFFQRLLRSLLPWLVPSPWSRTISRRSFMTECFIKAAVSRNSFINIFQRWYVTQSIPAGSQSYDKDIGKFIFTNLHKKATSSEAEDDQVLPRLGPLQDLFLRWPYDMRLLRWHIATEILYYTDDNQRGNDLNEFRRMSNLFSEYLMHLTFERGRIMSRFQGNFIFSYRDTSDYIRQNKEFEKWYRWGKTPSKDQVDRFYKKIMKEREGVPAEINQLAVVRDAVKIAQVLRNSFEEREMWEVISQVWVDMLVYAATHCDPMAYVEKLAQGGEFIAIVWLLSAHFGFGDFFLPEEEGESSEPSCEA